MQRLAILLFAGPLMAAPAFAQKGWQSLFDGKSFAGWHKYNGPEISSTWKIEDGAMALTGKGGGDLVTDKEYENFILDIEWKISEGGNSGIFWAVKEDPKYKTPYMTGPEIQVLDDAKHPDSFAGTSGNHKAGSLYDMIPPSDFSAVKPAGQWNQVRIKMDYRKNKATIWLNGKKVVKFQPSGASWDAMVNNSKFKGWEGFGMHHRGRIGIQDHGDQVWFRNIRIKEL